MPVNPACASALTSAPGLVALYLLDESTAAPGDTVSDSVGSHHGVVTNIGLGVITPFEDRFARDDNHCIHFDENFVSVAGRL